MSNYLNFADTHVFQDLEMCGDWKTLPTLQIDFALSTFFIVYFFIRFLAADDKLMFLFTVDTLVDFFTIPAVIVSVYFDRAWLGLRFLRALILLNLPDVLVYVRLINTSSAIRLCRLSAIFLSVVSCHISPVFTRSTVEL